MFAKVEMSNKVIIGRDALIAHFQNDEVVEGALVNLLINGNKTHGKVFVREGAVIVDSVDFGEVEIYSEAFNNLTASNFEALRYAL